MCRSVRIDVLLLAEANIATAGQGCMSESLMNCMEWIPQPCLCMLVGLNVGFTRAVTHRLMMEVQCPQNYRVLGCYLN